MKFIVSLTDCPPIMVPHALRQIADSIEQIQNTVLDFGGAPGGVSAAGVLVDGGRFEVENRE